MPRIVRCPNCDGPLPVDPKAPVLRCPYCHHDVKQTVAIPPPEPVREAPVVVIEKKFVVVSRPEVIRPTPTRRGGMGCATSLVTLIIISAAVGIPLWQSGLLKDAMRSVKGVVKGDPEPAEARKLDALGDLHAAGRSLRDSYERYRSWLRSPDGPTCKEQHIWGLYEVHLSAVDRGQTAIGEEPRLAELDAAAGSFAVALRAGAAVFNEARRYYDQKDYQDDGCAKGKTYHTAIEAAHQRVFGEEQKLRAILEQQVGSFLVRRLERWKREQPGGANATAIQALIHARELAFEIDRLEQAGEAEAEGTAPSAPKPKGSLEQVWSRIRALEGSLQAAVAAAAPEGGSRQGTVTWPYTMQSHFKPRLDELLKEAKAYAREPSPATMSASLKAWNDTVDWAGWAGPTIPSSQHLRARIGGAPADSLRWGGRPSRPSLNGRGIALQPGAPIASATLPLELVRRVVASHKQGLVRCLPAGTERIVIRFSVGKGGRVTAAELTEPATLAVRARRCLEAAVRRWVFPSTGSEFTITFPIRFR